MISVATDDAALTALEPEWTALWTRCPQASPFQSSAWLLPWWDAFGNGAPRVAVSRDDSGALTAVLPLYRIDGRLLPIGVGITDYQDALIAPDVSPNLVSHLLHAALVAEDGCDLTDVPPDAALRHAGPPPGRALTWQDSDPCPVLDLRDGFDRAVPSRMRRKLRMNANRAEAAGGVAVEIANPATVHDALGTLVRLHTQRWTEGGEPGVLADPAVLAFHCAAAPRLLDAGLLRLASLRSSNQPVAAVLAYADRADRIYFYLSGYAAEAASYSPGSLLIEAMLRDAIAEGRTEAHFLRGAESYKYAWGASDRWNATGRIARA